MTEPVSLHSTSTMISNLSKIKPKLRTTGRVSGNFGKNKVRAGSTLNEIGLSSKESVTVTRPSDYIARLYDAFDKTNDERLKRFIYTQIRDYLIQTNQW